MSDKALAVYPGSARKLHRRSSSESCGLVKKGVLARESAIEEFQREWLSRYS
jgi:hypothetical protein